MYPIRDVVACPAGTVFFLGVFTAAVTATLFCPVSRAAEDVFLREEFVDLERWKPLTFPKIKKHSTYSIEQGEKGSFLKAESDASASGIIYRETFPVYEYPRIRWRWKAERVYEKGNAFTKKGDDFPIRLYIIFPYDPDRAGLGKKLKYAIARILYGEYPPDSALNYIWANGKHEQRIIPNAYTGKSLMIVMRGPGDVGSWQVEEADILQDYREAFGKDPPPEASLAIMNDSDNTGESSISYLDYIEIFR
jgi:hypothetical protein